MPRHPRLAAMLALLSWCAPALALELPDWFKVDGFGTLGTYRADDDIASVRADARTPTPSRRQWRTDGDSLLGLQLQLSPSDSLSAVAQILSKDDIQGRMRPRVEWLYAAWDMHPQLQLKLGRTALPLYLNSDSRHLGYAQTSVRPVNTVYQLNPITHVDGVNLLARGRAAQGEWTLESALGRAQVGVAAGHINAPRVAALSSTWRRSRWMLRLAHAAIRLDAEQPLQQRVLSELASGATQCSNCAEAISQRAPMQGIQVHSTAGAAVYDTGVWALQLEATQRRSNSVMIPDVHAWYLQASVRLGAVTPYAVMGQLRFTEPALGLQSLPGATAAMVAANAAYDRFLQSANDRKIWQLGLRWDWRENLALKLQLEQFHHTRETRLGLINVVSYPFAPPLGSYSGAAWDGRVQVLSVNLDFVF